MTELEKAFRAEEKGFLDSFIHSEEDPTFEEWVDFMDWQRLERVQEWHELDETIDDICFYFNRRFLENE